MDIATASAAELAAAIADAEGWNPADGDELQGIVLGIRVGHSSHKEKAGRDPRYPIVFIHSDDGKVTAIHCFQSILENEVRNQKPIKGEEIYIKRIGEGKAKPGQNAPIRYAVQVIRDDSAEPDPWANL